MPSSPRSDWSKCVDCDADFWPDPDHSIRRCRECHAKHAERQMRIRDRLQTSGIYPRHGRWMEQRTLADWCVLTREHGGDPSQIERASERLFGNELELIALLGPRGTGKTQVAALLCKHLIVFADHPAKITTAWDMLCELKRARSFNASREVQQRARKPYEDPWLLVIDEFQVRLDSATEQAEIQTLIDWRYGQQDKPTIIISNLTEKGFREMAGESLVSRLQEVGGIVECNWRSFRLPPPEGVHHAET